MRRNILDFVFVHIVANGVTTAKKGKCKMVENLKVKKNCESTIY